MSDGVAAPRRQLTLFAPDPTGGVLDALRSRLDPVQARLIRAHVTLARDEEVVGLNPELVALRLARQPLVPVVLQFGAPTPFAGHGVLCPCIEGHAAFHALRALVLGVSQTGPSEPHLTLAHPRNPRAPGNVATSYASLRAPFTIGFPELCWIEQPAGEPWQVRHRYALAPV